jgi:hypothetical protein
VFSTTEERPLRMTAWNQSHTTLACQWFTVLPTPIQPGTTSSETISAAARLFSPNRDEV